MEYRAYTDQPSQSHSSNSFDSKHTYITEVGGYYNIYKRPPNLKEAMEHRVR